MTRSNKRGIELSINFLVMLMIAIVVFGFGIFFVGKVFGLGQDITADISANQKKQIEELLLSRGQRVTVVPQTLKLKAGDNGIVSVGVLNILQDTVPATPSRRFNVQVMYGADAFIPKGKSAAESLGTRKPVQFSGTTGQIPGNTFTIPSLTLPLVQVKRLTEKVIVEQDTYVFTFSVSSKGAAPGTHILTLIVGQGEGSSAFTGYETPQQVLVIVE